MRTGTACCAPRADFDNFKKRAAREKQEAIKYANESLLQKLVPVLDSLDMALAAAQTTGPDASQSLQAGVGMICQQLKGALADAGLEELDAVGKPFDPNLHEALAQQEIAGRARRPGGPAASERLQAARPTLAPGQRRRGQATHRLSHGQTRLLRSPRRRADGGGGRNQEGLPQARAEVSSGQEPGRQDGRGEVQGTRRGLRDPQRPAEARALRPVRPRRVRPPGRRLRGRRLPRSIRDLPRGLRRRRHLRGSLRRRAGPTPPSPSAATTSATTWKSRSRRPPTGARRKSPSPNPSLAKSARARARRPVPASGPARPAAAAARSSIRAAFSASPRPARIARAPGASSKSPARPAAARGGASAPRKSSCAFPPAWTPARACAPPAMAKPASAAARAGDLYVVLHVKAHAIFQRDGDDLLCEVPVSFVQAALGAEIEVPALDGAATIKIPAGTQPGTMFRLKGQRHKERSGLWPRRLARPHQCRSADSPVIRPKSEAPGIRRPLQRQGKPHEPELLREGKETVSLNTLGGWSDGVME